MATDYRSRIDGIAGDHDRPGHAGWGWVVGYGIALLLLGLMPFLQPVMAGLALAWIVGIVLIAAGALVLWAGISGRGWRNRWIDIAIGILSLLTGGAMLASPMLGALSLAWMLGFWLVVCGIAELAVIASARLHRGWLAVMGVIDIVLGCFLFAADPVTALAFLGFALGISLIFRGMSLLFLGLRLRQF
ncbi:HdeD family acid-resistance protein [Sphingobium algorifonticola]|uniref:HdeD family acid-resistance protein n=1 Tax=Sphingobium algorifonticola TaxID=2008318 RepID=A0A437J4G6_9SPHN|nr:DUF308 domain-containing protein [Sphingobium algorifonticola]RVT39556.1 hypothetical protein ENE74_14405 [Sphingobium algorifonticola]